MVHDYLNPTDDGLIMRNSQDYAKDKLTILKGYMARFTTSMKDKGWRALNYIDLQAGPGKNMFNPSGEIKLGSPLLALTTRYPFDNLFLVEMGKREYVALKARVDSSDLNARARLFNEDSNIAVDRIVSFISQVDAKFLTGKWPSLNLAFLDPEGLEIQWQTVEKLANVSRMDLIINFSTSGITRNAGLAAAKVDDSTVDRFFGTREWRTAYESVRNQDSSVVRRTLIDFYLSRLNDMGYVKTVPQEKVFKNQRNVQIYTMIFASKNDLGIRFWNGAVQEVRQPPLL